MLQKNCNVHIGIDKVCTASPAKWCMMFTERWHSMILANHECHQLTWKLYSKSQILISYFSDIPHNRHGSLFRHKLLLVMLHICNNVGFQILLRFHPLSLIVFFTASLQHMYSCAHACWFHDKMRKRCIAVTALVKICRQEIFCLLLCLLWLRHHSYFFFCCQHRLLAATMHSSLRVRGKLTQMYSVSLATSISCWRTIKKVSLFVCLAKRAASHLKGLIEQLE